MERLTQTSDKGGVAFTFDLDVTCQPSEIRKILKIAEKLKEYEDLEEQGLLLRLPCKVGDTVYRINNGARKPIIPLYVVEIRFKQVGSYIREKICCSDDSMTNTASSIYYKEDIGNRIFLSKAEAEQKLKEMEDK